MAKVLEYKIHWMCICHIYFFCLSCSRISSFRLFPEAASGVSYCKQNQQNSHFTPTTTTPAKSTSSFCYELCQVFLPDFDQIFSYVNICSIVLCAQCSTVCVCVCVCAHYVHLMNAWKMSCLCLQLTWSSQCLFACLSFVMWVCITCYKVTGSFYFPSKRDGTSRNESHIFKGISLFSKDDLYAQMCALPLFLSFC